MKKITLILITVITALNISAQPSVAVIDGIIQNNSRDSIRILLQESFMSPQISYKSEIGPIGHFKFAIPVTESKPVLLRAGDETITLYVSPGDKVHCTFHMDSVIKTIKFTGNNAEQYNYFIDYYQKFGFQHGMFFKPDYSDVFTQNPSEFKTYRQGKVVADMNFLKDYSATHNLSDNFRTYAEADIKYSYYYALLSYSSFKKFFRKIDEVIPEGFYADISKDLFNRIDILNSENYLNAMKMYMSEIIAGGFKDAETFYPKALELSSRTLTGKSLYMYQAYLLNSMLNVETKPAIKDSLITHFLNSCPFNEYKGPVILALNKSRTSAEKILPRKVLSASLIDTENRNMSLKEIFQANKGNVIYIDFWASWCGPCKREMPYSQNLGEKFKNKSVKFIYFSVDEKPDLWRKAMITWNVKGQNYLVLNQFKSPIATHFNISSIPHYVLINKNGEIAFSSAASPSSPGIESTIETLLSDQ